VKSGIFFASKRNEIFASISNFASEAKVRAHPRDLGTKQKKIFFLHLTPDFDGFWFLPHTECAVNQNQNFS
jgi:hypothetical protein